MSNNPAEPDYISLPSDDPYVNNGGLDHEKWSQQSRNTRRTTLMYRGVILLQNIVIFAFAVIIWSKYYRSHESTCSQVIYCGSFLFIQCSLISKANYSAAPAQHLVEYYPVTFSTGFGNETTIYQAPPSDTVDKAWSDLYNGALQIFLMFRIQYTQVVLFLRAWYLWGLRGRGRSIVSANRPQWRRSISCWPLCISRASLLGKRGDIYPSKWSHAQI